jgi:arylsulfatase A-like enzyme
MKNPLLALALGLAGCSTADSVPPRPDKPAPDTSVEDTQVEAPCDHGLGNVVLVLWDTVRADHLSTNGYARDTTPALSEIAAEGTVFLQATSGSYWTTSSIASLFSGMASHNHGVDYPLEDGGMTLDDDIVTMAEAMQARGYHTAMYTNQALVYYNDSLSQGFDEWRFLDADDIVNNAITLMDRDLEQPWFMVAYWMGAHAPYDPDEAYDLWATEGVEDINVLGCDGVDPSQYPEGWTCFNDLNSGDVQWTEREWDYIRARYDGDIRQHDAWLGELWDALECRDMADSTLFAFTSDHGEALHDHGDVDAWHIWPYDNTLRVPLVLRWPTIFPARQRHNEVRTMDLYATLTELSCQPAEHELDSLDLLDAFEGQVENRAAVGATMSSGGRQWYRHDGWKLIWSRENEAMHSHELFDLEADPTEQHNLWDSRPEKVEQLRAAHAAYLEDSTIGHDHRSGR